MNTEASMHHPGKHHGEKINIQIDRIHYQVSTDSMTGQQLRDLVSPPIPLTRDLFRVIPGADDEKIELTTVVHLHEGMRFFTAPARINPGREGVHHGVGH